MIRSFPWSIRIVSNQRARPAPRQVRALQPAVPCDDEAPSTCGWFDSSHDLGRGLQVCELDSPEALARELPLASWLELQLAACSPALRA